MDDTAFFLAEAARRRDIAKQNGDGVIAEKTNVATEKKADGDNEDMGVKRDGLDDSSSDEDMGVEKIVKRVKESVVMEDSSKEDIMVVNRRGKESDLKEMADSSSDEEHVKVVKKSDLKEMDDSSSEEDIGVVKTKGRLAKKIFESEEEEPVVMIGGGRVAVDYDGEL
jgi:hypothetical protein